MVEVWRILRESVLEFISFYDGLMMIIVLLNAAVDVALTFHSVVVTAGWYLTVLEIIFLGFYIAECVFKIATLRCRFFLSLLNILDLLITLIGVVDLLVDVFNPSTTESSHFASFFRLLKMVKGLRAVKVFRILRVLGYSQEATNTWIVLQRSTKSIVVILSLMLCNFLMFAIIFRETFHHSDPKKFGTLVDTMATLMQVFSLDDWLSVYNTSRDNGAGYIMFFLVVFILIECFMLLGLAGAVLLDNFIQAEKERRAKEATEGNHEEERASEEQTDETMNNEDLVEETCIDASPLNQHSERRKAIIEKCLRIQAQIDEKQELFRKQTRILNMFTECILSDPPEPCVASGDLRGPDEA